MSINNVILSGRLGDDPQLRKTQSGLSVCNFQLAVERLKLKGQEKAEVDWISCQVWRGSADFICNYAHKGATLNVTGRLQARSYDDSTRRKVYITEVVCDHVEIPRQPAGQTGKQQRTGSTQGTQYSGEGFANNYTVDNYKDSFNDFDTGPTLDISSDDLPF